MIGTCKKCKSVATIENKVFIGLNGCSNCNDNYNANDIQRKMLKSMLSNKGESNRIRIKCDSCAHRCTNSITFEPTDSMDYINSVVETFTCPVVSGSYAKWRVG